MTDHLFVYGTLMMNIESKVSRFLKKHSQFVAKGSVPGRLFDLGRYPGLVYKPDMEFQVYGHVFQLADPSFLFSTLDPYEGYSEAFPQQCEYIRKVVPVKCNGKVYICWTYLYNQSTDGLAVIPTGDYLLYLKNNRDHQDFIRSV